MAQTEKNLPAMQATRVQPLIWDDPLEKGKATHSGILVWRILEPNGQRSLVGYSPWGLKESDTTERLSIAQQHGKINLFAIQQKLTEHCKSTTLQ